MPSRDAASRALAELFRVLSNPHRIRIVEHLRAGEVDVNGLQEATGLTHSNVSQHLSVLRAHRLVRERRDGRHVYYQLSQPQLAEWILSGLDYVGGDIRKTPELHALAEEARGLWAGTDASV